MGCDILENTRVTCMQLQHSRCYIDCLAFESSKLRLDEAGGVMGATPEGMGHHIL